MRHSASYIRQLHIRSNALLMRWLAGPGFSYRAYEIKNDKEQSLCVATRSAELTLILKGELWLEIGPARQQFRLLPGQIAVMLRGTPHRLFVTAGTEMLIVDMTAAVPGQLGIAELPDQARSHLTDRLIAKLWDQPLGDVYGEANSVISELTAQLGNYRLTPLESAFSTRRMIQIKTFIENNYKKKINIDTIARRFGLDRHYLVRNFKQNFGTPPLAYANFLRLENFLWSTVRLGDHTLAATAHESGFFDYPTFSRRIRKIYGFPPSQLITVR